MEVPLITRVYLTSSMLTTAACSLELVSPFSLFFNMRLVFVKLQARDRALGTGVGTGVGLDWALGLGSGLGSGGGLGVRVRQAAGARAARP